MNPSLLQDGSSRTSEPARKEYREDDNKRVLRLAVTSAPGRKTFIWEGKNKKTLRLAVTSAPGRKTFIWEGNNNKSLRLAVFNLCNNEETLVDSLF